MKCSICGKNVKDKNVRMLDGKSFGIECWKQAVEEKREAGLDVWKLKQYQKTLLFVEMLRMKDMSKIKNQFKLDFVSSMVNQFDLKGFVTKKQKVIILGDGERNQFGFVNAGWLNNKDYFNLEKLADEHKVKVYPVI